MNSLKNPPYVVAMPTETVYGLAARVDSPEGIQNIFKIKERPFFDPLIVHIADISQAKQLVKFWPKAAHILAENFWPGPLTLVLEKNSSVSDLITSGLNTVGIRMPRHNLALQLIRDEGVPLAAPSANKFGRTSPTTAEHVRAEFGAAVPIIDGGPCAVGLESTVLLVEAVDDEMCSLAILRPGAVTASQIEAVMQQKQHRFAWLKTVTKEKSPGHMKHHYMPKIPLVLVRNPSLTESQILEKANEEFPHLPENIEGVKIIKPLAAFSNIRELVLSREAAVAFRELYSELRRLAEQPGTDLLYFRLRVWHDDEIWNVLVDRLTKAASIVVD